MEPDPITSQDVSPGFFCYQFSNKKSVQGGCFLKEKREITLHHAYNYPPGQKNPKSHLFVFIHFNEPMNKCYEFEYFLNLKWLSIEKFLCAIGDKTP